MKLIDMGCDVFCVNLVDRADPSEIIDAEIMMFRLSFLTGSR
ncbi:MAG: hypothetical protein ACLTCI_04100 [[Clostridium] nexile]